MLFLNILASERFLPFIKYYVVGLQPDATQMPRGGAS